jgi:hypothetical protein
MDSDAGSKSGAGWNEAALWVVEVSGAAERAPEHSMPHSAHTARINLPERGTRMEIIYRGGSFQTKAHFTTGGRRQ